MSSFALNGALGASPFPPIADYAFLSDCETTRAGRAERQRRVAVPAAHGLAERLRRDPRPRRRRVPAWARRTSRCPPRGATCRARWCSRRAGARPPAGSSSATSCSSGRGTTRRTRSTTHRRAPTDYDADHVLLRTVRCVNGEVQLDARLRAGASTTAACAARWEYDGDGYHQAWPRPTGADPELHADHRHATSASKGRAPRRGR